MSKRTIALIALLIVSTAFLLALALNPQSKTTPKTIAPAPTKMPVLADSILSISPNSLTLPTGRAQNGTLNIDINTGRNKVTAVQLELSYDPSIFKNVEISSPSGQGFFENPIVLLKNIDSKNGRITYALGIAPTGNGKSGAGTVATITFQAQSNTPLQAQFTFLPKSLVTAEAVTSSVLKQGQAGVIIFEGSSSPSSTGSAQ